MPANDQDIDLWASRYLDGEAADPPPGEDSQSRLAELSRVRDAVHGLDDGPLPAPSIQADHIRLAADTLRSPADPVPTAQPAPTGDSRWWQNWMPALASVALFAVLGVAALQFATTPDDSAETAASNIESLPSTINADTDVGERAALESAADDNDASDGASDDQEMADEDDGDDIYDEEEMADDDQMSEEASDESAETGAADAPSEASSGEFGVVVFDSEPFELMQPDVASLAGETLDSLAKTDDPALLRPTCLAESTGEPVVSRLGIIGDSAAELIVTDDHGQLVGWLFDTADCSLLAPSTPYFD